MEKLRIDVGDRGYVLLKDWMGTDLSPVNDAKVSFDKEASELGPKESASFTILLNTSILLRFATLC